MGALRAGFHALLLRGLRAPRLAHPVILSDLNLGGFELRLAGANGKTLFAWFVPSLGAAPAPAVLVMHGWGANAAMMAVCLTPLQQAGMATLLVDARCHGRSDDEDFTSLPRFAEDIASGLDWLREQAQVDRERLAIVGHSVGACAALLCASKRLDVAAVVSISAFAHPYDVMRRFLASHHIPYLVLGWYVLRHVQHVIGATFDDIAPLRTIASVRCPVLLVHGLDDEMVPFDDARHIQAAGVAGQVALLAVAARHDPSGALQEHLPQILDFLHRALRTSCQPSK
ncbi:MAG: alpha/beta fold hydrolase [Comamonadaceae bacterium]|nr:alpha/beta fold hydrolase [Comamonadaceae bacterium]